MAVLPYISLATTGSATPQQIPVFPTLPQGWSITKTPSWPGRSLRSVSGLEWRATDQTYPRYEWELTYPILRDGSYAKHTGGTGDGYDEFHDLAGFFNLFAGGFSTFLYDDPTDDSVVGQTIATGDGSTSVWQLVRTVGGELPGGGWSDPIYAVNTILAVYLDGAPTDGYTVNYLSGQIRLCPAPADGVVVTVDFAYYWYARFMQDSMNFENFMVQLWQNKLVKFTSVIVPGALPPPCMLTCNWTWIQQSSPGSAAWNATAASNDGQLLAAISNSALWISIDGGSTWTNPTIPVPSLNYAWVAVTKPTSLTSVILILAAAGPLLRSTDLGVTWNDITPPAATLDGQVTISTDGNKIIVADSGSFGYPWTTTNAGVSWTRQTSPFGASASIVAGSRDGSTFIAGDGSSFYYSHDSGATWNSSTAALLMATSNNGSVILTWAPSAAGYLKSSVDGGVTFNDVTHRADWLEGFVRVGGWADIHGGKHPRPWKLHLYQLRPGGHMGDPGPGSRLLVCTCGVGRRRYYHNC